MVVEKNENQLLFYKDLKGIFCVFVILMQINFKFVFCTSYH